MKVLGRALDRDVYIVELERHEYLAAQRERQPCERCERVDAVVREAFSSAYATMSKLEDIRRPR